MSVKTVSAVAIFCFLIVGGTSVISTGNLEQGGAKVPVYHNRDFCYLICYIYWTFLAWVVKYLVDLSLILKDGAPAVGIPKADPVPISLHFTVNNDIFRGSVAVDGQLGGFSNYFVSNATLNPNLFVDLDLIFVSTTFRGTYTLDSTLYKGVVPLSGSGPIKIDFSFVEMAANGTLVGKDQMVQLKDFNFEIKEINAVEIGAEGLLKDYGLDVVLEPALRNSLNTVIKVFRPDVQNFVNWYVDTNGNKALRNVTIAKILEIIKNLMGVGDSLQFSAASQNPVKRDLRSSGEAVRKLWELLPIVTAK